LKSVLQAIWLVQFAGEIGWSDRGISDCRATSSEHKTLSNEIRILDNISAGGKYPQVVSEQLVRLYDFGSSQALLLKEAIQKNIIDGKEGINLSSFEFIDPINCKLDFQISNEDTGITTNDKYNFVCSMTIKGYETMVYLIEPFCHEHSGGYQWLYHVDCAINFLFSPGGTW
jgi:hypothetical protein